METTTQPPADAELHLLTEWRDEAGESRRRKAAVATVALHICVIGILIALPSDFFAPPRPVETAEVRHITPIFEPLTELTQKAPNKDKVKKEFEVAGAQARPREQSPQTPPPAPKPAPPRAVIPAMPQPKAAPEQPLPEPPKIEAANKPPRIELPPSLISQPPPPAPKNPPVEKPKITFENLGAPPPPVPPGEREVQPPDTSVREAIRGTMHQGSAGRTVGDAGALTPSGLGGVNLPPSPGKQAAAMELKSDEQGVDFYPYLTQVLAIIRRNWEAVMPESVKQGRRGKVVMQLSIGRDGRIDKLVYAAQSGTDALDKAAVAGISASNPLPPLPPAFKGGRIVVQLNFVYNLPSR